MRALTTHASHRHAAFGMTICIQRRQLDIWIDLEMISLFGGQELLSQHRNLLNISMLFFFKKKNVKEGEERRGNVR